MLYMFPPKEKAPGFEPVIKFFKSNHWFYEYIIRYRKLIKTCTININTGSLSNIKN